MTILRLNARVPSREGGSSSAPAEKAIPLVTSGARALALAHFIEDALESGRVTSAAAVARTLGVTRARVSQVMALLGLSARIQEQVLMGDRNMTPRALRQVAAIPSWVMEGERYPVGSGSREP